MVPPAPLEHFSSLLGNFKAAFTGMDIQKILRSPTNVLCLKHTHIYPHMHTQSQGSQPYMFVPSNPALLMDAAQVWTWGNTGTEETIPNMPVPCSHGNSILAADIP